MIRERAASGVPSCQISFFIAASTHTLSEPVNGCVADAFRALMWSPWLLVSLPNCVEHSFVDPIFGL